MKSQIPIVFAALAGFAAAEVPQEHSHEKYLRAVNELLAQDNPKNIQDAVFGLLGNAAAEAGAGDVTNLDCLHQETADSAFTTAKAAGDVDGMASALVFRAIERNTGSVGLKSVLCDETAANPEIAALTQHQDPASENAAEENKAITLALAQQLAAIGADPMLALESGTFEPGDPNDNTGAGNTCDDADDAEGCIFTQNLLVEDATAEEIQAAVADGATGAGGAAGNETASSNSTAAAFTRRKFRRDVRRRRAANIVESDSVNTTTNTAFVIPRGKGAAAANGNAGNAANNATDDAVASQGNGNANANGNNNGNANNNNANNNNQNNGNDAADDADVADGADAVDDADNTGNGNNNNQNQNQNGNNNQNNGNADAADGADDADAVDDADNAGNNGNNNQNNNGNNNQNGNDDADAADGADDANNNAGNDAATGTQDVQTFTGDLGGPAPPVTSSAASDKPFEVNGATFLNAGAALQRSCAVQHNACADAANSGSEDISVADCDAQEDDCLAAASLKKLRRSSSVGSEGRRMRIASNVIKTRQSLDFGECQDPSIQFAEGLDGRDQASFAPAGDFSHGSANNINIISSFICGQLSSRCQADDAAVQACEQGQADAQGLEGQDAADAFNSALGL